MFIRKLIMGVAAFLMLQGMVVLPAVAQTSSDESRQRALEEREKQRERVEERRTEFESRIAEIRDEQRRRLAERIAENLNRVNDVLIGNYLRFLDHLGDLLDRMEDRAIKFGERGADISGVAPKVETARGEIESAKEMVLVQQEKVYVAEITSLDNLRDDFKKTAEEFRADHQAIRREVLSAAKDAVREAFTALKDAAKTFSKTPTSTDEDTGTSTEN